MWKALAQEEKERYQEKAWKVEADHRAKYPGKVRCKPAQHNVVKLCIGYGGHKFKRFMWIQ
jgi:hypothetical protein